MKTFLLELDNRGNSGANTCIKILFGDLSEQKYLLDWRSVQSVRGLEPSSVNHDNFTNRSDLSVGDESFKFLPYQLTMVVYWTTMVLTGDGELGFDSGEGALELATTSKEGSRRANYPIPTRGGSNKE